VIAGPNGSGKSTITRTVEFEAKSNLIDPDAIARRIRPDSPKLAAVAAGRETIHREREHLEHQESFAVETTLSSVRNVEMMREAKARGFAVHLIYLCLDSAERNVARVQERVMHGGHDVPADDVRRRYDRSLRNLPEAIRIADEATLYDNGDAHPRKVLEARAGRVTWRDPNPPRWLAAVLASSDMG
jgi:predicted ABC-type ATPase